MARDMSYAADVRPRLRVPARAASGEVVEIATLITHPMESGHRVTAEGTAIARLIIQSMVARYNGQVVFEAEWGSGIAANPYQAFSLRIDQPGRLEVVWRDEAGSVWREEARIDLA